MSSPFDPASQGGPPAPKPRSKLLIGCLIAVAVGAVGCGGLVVLFIGVLAYGQAEVAPTAEKFLDTLEAGEYDSAFAQIGDDWRKITNPEDFRATLSGFQEKLGPQQSRSQRGINVSSNTDQGTTATIDYEIRYQNDTAQVEVLLKQYGDEWKVVGVNWDAEVFRQ